MKLTTLLARHRWVGPLMGLVLVFALFAALLPDKLTQPITLMTMARATAVVGIAASGATLVIILGGIDLSVGSAVALTTVVIALVLKSDVGGVLGAVSLGVLVAASAGALNGGLTVGLGITPFIVTLGTMGILRGIAIGLAHEQRVYVDAHGIDALVLPSHGFLGLPLAVWLLALVAGATAAFLNNTRFGRAVVAIGSNERTTLLAGIRVKRIKIATYAIASGLAGVAGIVEFGRLTVGDPTDSVGLELAVIASSVIGGASLAGGEGSVLGTIFGAMMMTVIQTGCSFLGLTSWLQMILTGVIIITAAALDRLRQRR
jgi:ribose/xylose/arabinose/galactoside ABC-type transport system permease subunit